MFSGEFRSEHNAFVISPLPSPTVLQGYEALNPGTTNRFLILIEKEQPKRHERQDREMDLLVRTTLHRQRLAWAGLGTAFIISMVVLVGSFYLALNDKRIESIVGILGSLGSLVGIFVAGHRTLTERDE